MFFSNISSKRLFERGNIISKVTFNERTSDIYSRIGSVKWNHINHLTIHKYGRVKVSAMNGSGSSKENTANFFSPFKDAK